MNKHSSMPDYSSAGELDPDSIILRMKELEESAKDRNFKYVQFRTQHRNLFLAYMHAVTQSGFVLSFYKNGAVKSISPKGERLDASPQA